MGLVGGGEGAFIGSVHRIAAELDGKIELVCSACASDPNRAKRSGVEIYGLDPTRSYASFDEMIDGEATLPLDRRMDFVCLTTPNHIHFEHAKAALEAGFHVMCEKPITYSLEQARQLQSLVENTELLFGLTHNYTGYPMIKEARELVRSAEFGRVRRISIEYIQGWLSNLEEGTGDNKQAEWRTDPNRSGVAGCMGDIGTHGENLAEYVTGIKIESLCADLTTFVDGRQLDDDGNVLLRFESGAKGILSASQISVGVENGLTLRVYGERCGVEWQQMEPNSLVVRWADRPAEIRRTGGPGTSPQSIEASRIPPGHPEGYLEAFALLYRNYAQAIQDRKKGQSKSVTDYDFPTVYDGVRGMEFIETVVESSNRGAVWLNMP